MRRSRLLAVASFAASALMIAPVASSAAPAAANPVVTWAASAQQMGDSGSDQTYRLIVHTSTGGTGLRIRLSNAFGDRPVVFGSVYAGGRVTGATVAAGSNRRLSFAGSPSVTVAPGGIVYSDPLPGSLPPQSDLAISLYVSSAGGPATGHGLAMQTSFQAAGDHAAEEGGAVFTGRIGSWYYLDALVVDAPSGIGAVAVFGDSISDGWQSGVDRNTRWPDYLARRLLAEGSNLRGVANEGISGNKVLADGAGQSALNRLDRDVLSQPGLRTVILLEGVNDIKDGTGVTAAGMIAAYRLVIARVHAAGKCVVGATIMPFQGWGEWTEAAELVRQQINTFVLTGREFDAALDLDENLWNPFDHTRIFPKFDNGDHLHPNEKGMQAIADSIDLAALRCTRR